MWKHFLGGGLGLLLLIGGCSGPQKVVTLTPGGGQVVAMQASSFDFDPDVIRARQGDRLVLAIENIAGRSHNFTLKDPAGVVLVSEDLSGHQTLRVVVPLTQSGEYFYYCDKPLHATFGMKGHVVVEP